MWPFLLTLISLYIKTFFFLLVVSQKKSFLIYGKDVDFADGIVGPVTKLKNLSDVHSILLGAVENDFQLVIQKESYKIVSNF